MPPSATYVEHYTSVIYDLSLYDRTYAVRFVVAQCIARLAGRAPLGTSPDMLFCVETVNKLPDYEPLDVQLRKSYAINQRLET